MLLEYDATNYRIKIAASARTLAYQPQPLVVSIHLLSFVCKYIL